MTIPTHRSGPSEKLDAEIVDLPEVTFHLAPRDSLQAAVHGHNPAALKKTAQGK
jgi:hypothetical protein